MENVEMIMKNIKKNNDAVTNSKIMKSRLSCQNFKILIILIILAIPFFSGCSELSFTTYPKAEGKKRQ